MATAWLVKPVLALAGAWALFAGPQALAEAPPGQLSWSAPGPLGACRIYVQGRSAACDIITERACQRLSEIRRGRHAIVSRRWYALPAAAAWDMPRC